MKITSWRVSFALLGIGTLFLFEFCAYQEDGNQCRKKPAQRFISWKPGDHEFNGKELMKLFDEVKTMVMFIGHPRSAHSLIGALLDAHPEIIISHQFNIAKYWDLAAPAKSVKKYRLFYELFATSKQQALFYMRSPAGNSRSTYSYHVHGAWQGTYKNRLKVIGDKTGGETSVIPPSKLLPFFKELEEVTGIPLRLIHVVRNPFDNIATIALRKEKTRDKVRDTSQKMNNSDTLDWAISYYFIRSFTNKHVLEQRGDIVLTLGSHEITQRPRETLQRLCDHLMVTCYQEFVDACTRFSYDRASMTRNSVVWTDAQKERVLGEMKKYPFLENYNFEDIP